MKNVTREVSRTAGKMDVMLDVDGTVGALSLKVLPNADYEMVLGADFAHDWVIETKWKWNEWRVADGEWRKFNTYDKEGPGGIIAECAGIPALSEDEKQLVENLDLNTVTVKDAYAIPCMDSILDKLRKARYLSKVDLKWAYHLVPMDEASKKYTAFAIPGSGLYKFIRMPFGLTNAPMTFQRLIDAIFGPEFEPHIFGYLDDIIITTDALKEHLKWLEVVLRKVVEAGMVVNRDKCEFCCSGCSTSNFCWIARDCALIPRK